MIKKIRNIKNKKLKFFSFVFLLSVFFVVGEFCRATELGVEENTSWGGYAVGAVGAAVSKVLALIALIITSVVGLLIKLFVEILIQVAQYNDIIGVSTVVEGWVIIRDLCNMFFILILLVIAFGTILRQENYSAKKLLSKVLIMAILINFSRMFFGLIIDFAQVIMLTFVSSFRDSGGFFIDAFNVDGVLSFSPNDNNVIDSAVGPWTVVLAVISGALASIITLVVVAVILAVLVVRIVMLWIYAILSPFVFLGWAFPPLQKYTNRIWEDFIKQVMVGPILAFFIWLALITAQNTASGLQGGNIISENQCTDDLAKFFCNTDFQTYLLVIGLLMGGLMVAQQAGGAAGKAAGAVSSKGFGLAKLAGKKSGGVALSGAKSTGRSMAGVASGIDRFMGRGVESFTGLKTGNKGLVGSTAALTMAVPGKLIKQHRDVKNKNLDLDRQLRDARDDESKKIKHEGREYKYNKLSKRYQELDENGEFKVGGDILKRGKKEVEGKMGAWRASFFDAREWSQSSARAASNKAEEESVDKEKQKILDSNMSTGEMTRLLNDATTSEHKKMALAMTLAIKKGFKDNEGVEKGRNALKHNSILTGKFNEEVYKNQAHIAHDLKTESGKKKFQDAIDSGKIDSTKLSDSAYKDESIMRVLEDYHGDDFDRVITTAFKRGKKYEKTISEGLLKFARDVESQASEETDLTKKQKLEKKARGLRGTHAETTGDVSESFRKVSGGAINTDALKEYIGRAKAKDLNKISVEELIKIDAEQPNLVSSSMNYAKIKSMYKQGDNPELVKLLKQQMLSNNHPDRGKILSDNELSSL